MAIAIKPADRKFLARAEKWKARGLTNEEVCAKLGVEKSWYYVQKRKAAAEDGGSPTPPGNTKRAAHVEIVTYDGSGATPPSSKPAPVMRQCLVFVGTPEQAAAFYRSLK